MKYLLIFFIIAVVLSPLTWLRTSPRQQKITAFRNQARALGLVVELVPRVDAPEDEKQPTAVRYLLATDLGKAESQTWTLARASRGGWESSWEGWRWLKRECSDAAILAEIGSVVEKIPSSVNALRVDRKGISAYWDERGTDDDVACIKACLDHLVTNAD